MSVKSTVKTLALFGSMAAGIFGCGDKGGDEGVKPNPGPLPSVGVSVDIGNVTEITTGAGMDPQDKSKSVAIFESFKFSSGADGALSGGMSVSFVGHSPENMIVTDLGNLPSSPDFQVSEITPRTAIKMKIKNGTGANFGKVTSKAGVTQVFRDDPHMDEPHTHEIEEYVGTFNAPFKVVFDKIFKLNGGDVFSGTERFQQLGTPSERAAYNFYVPK